MSIRPPPPGGTPLDQSKVTAFRLRTFQSLPHPVQSAPLLEAINQPSDYETRDSISDLSSEVGGFCHERPLDNILAYRGCKAVERPWYRRKASDVHNFQFFYVYEYLFTDLGIKLPFCPFVCSVLRDINASPCQLHPNAWAFIRCFEILCDAVHREPSTTRFYYLYDMDAKSLQLRGWVSLKARAGRKCFNPF